MSGLGRIVSELSHYRKVAEALTASSSRGPGEQERGALVEIPEFGLNPGNLRMLVHVPENLPPRPALVVVLHGCTQTAEGYDRSAGWSALADAHGFAVLYPEQRTANNAKGCFSWFDPNRAARGRGEAASIHQMIERMSSDLAIDRDRIFITGLSAGGAMTSVMLASYPEVFAAGAIIAGLPYGAARSVHEAFKSMFSGTKKSARDWGDMVREASPHQGPWPKISIWHGDADTTVQPANAQEIVKQWTHVHGLPLRASMQRVEGDRRIRQWRDPTGEVRIEEHIISGMKHGTPLLVADDMPDGEAGPFMLDVGISSTQEIAEFWGLVKAQARRPAQTRSASPPRDGATATRDNASTVRGSVSALESTISDALRKAGLMR